MGGGGQGGLSLPPLFSSLPPVNPFSIAIVPPVSLIPLLLELSPLGFSALPPPVPHPSSPFRPKFSQAPTSMASTAHIF